MEEKEAGMALPRANFPRVPHDSGCPHNTSTVVPEGSRALGGIGRHYMAYVDGPQHRTPSPTWAAKA